MPEIVTAEPPTESEELPIAKPVGAAVKVWPATVKTDCVGDAAPGRATVLLPTRRPPLFGRIEIAVPETVIADPPAERVLVPITKPAPLGAAVRVCPATTTEDGKRFGGIATVLLPTRMPLSFGRTETTFPDTVAALPPALIIAPLGRVTMPLKGALEGWTPFWRRSGIAVGAAGRPKVLASTTTLLEPAETTWPEMVAWLPEAMVEPATTTPPPGAI